MTKNQENDQSIKFGSNLFKKKVKDLNLRH